MKRGRQTERSPWCETVLAVRAIAKASRAVARAVRYTVFAMQSPVTAQDLLPLVEKLSHEEQVRLARLALRAATLGRSSRGI